ncbi:hypothetical protein N9V96_01865 [Polaribacter sp.]|nr:hypothetical protein [Polaribacter sp.]
MSTSVLILTYSFAGILIFAGIMHIIKPRVFKNFTPPFLPLKITNYAIGFIEFSLGVALLFKNTQKIGGIAIFILMLIFLPIHIWDATKLKPAIGSKTVAYIRIPIQFLLLYVAYLIYTNS